MKFPTRCGVCPLSDLPCKQFRGKRGGQCPECLHFAECHRRHKYRAKACEMDGHRFASQAERDRYVELKLMAASGAISGLKLQPRYPLYAMAQIPETDFASPAVRVCEYRADFEYEMAGEVVTEDVKGFRTDVYRIKAKWFAACYGREVQEIKAGRRKKCRQ